MPTTTPPRSPRWSGAARLSLLLHARRRSRATRDGAAIPTARRCIAAAAWPSAARRRRAARAGGAAALAARHRRARWRCAPRAGLDANSARATRADDVAAEPERWGDILLRGKDRPASYHLAVVVDDALQGVTDVVRGRDLFARPRCIGCCRRCSDLPAPRYRHHRLVLDGDGAKLSKSAKSQASRALARAGVQPRPRCAPRWASAAARRPARRRAQLSLALRPGAAAASGACAIKPVDAVALAA